MKHQLAISNQRVLNMQAGINTANDQITCLENRLETITTPENFAKFKESLIDDVEEINMFLNWVSNQ